LHEKNEEEEFLRLRLFGKENSSHHQFIGILMTQEGKKNDELSWGRKKSGRNGHAKMRRKISQNSLFFVSGKKVRTKKF